MNKVKAIILETLEEMFIKEIGDSTSQAYPWKVQSINKSGETGKPVLYSYEFEVPADDESDAEFYEVDMAVEDRYAKDQDMSWQIAYKPQGQNYDYNSNRGKQYQIMATVVEIIKDFEKREKPMRAEIHPSKNETEDTRRLNFYMQYIKKQLPPEYNLSMSKDLDGEEIILILHQDIDKEPMNEVGEANSQPYPWVKGGTTDLSINYRFTTDSNLEYYVGFEKQSDTYWVMGFFAYDQETRKQYHNNAMTNRDEVYRVMTTIIGIIKEFAQEYNPQTLSFEPAKNSSDDQRRANLYAAYIKRSLPSGYKVKEIDGVVYIQREKMNYFESIIREELNQMNKQDILKSYYELAEDKLQKSYWLILSNALTLEKVFGDDLALAGKYVDKNLQVEPIQDKDQLTQKFMELYDTYHPVRNAVETMDSVESVRLWLAKHPEFFKQFISPMPMDEDMQKNGNTYKVYHGTNQDFEDFDISRATQGIIWFTDSISSIQKGEHGGLGNKNILTRYITLSNPAGWNEYEKLGLGQIEDRGYDGVILPHGTEYNDYIVFDTKNIHKEPQ